MDFEFGVILFKSWLATILCNLPVARRKLGLLKNYVHSHPSSIFIKKITITIRFVLGLRLLVGLIPMIYSEIYF